MALLNMSTNSDLLKSSRVLDTSDNPFRTSTDAILKDNRGKCHQFKPTNNKEILELNRRAAEDRPKSTEFDKERAAMEHEFNKNDYRVKAALAGVEADMADVAARTRNPIHIKRFCEKLDNLLGKYFGQSRVYLNQPPADPTGQFKNQMGLFIRIRGMERYPFHDDLPLGWKKITSVQVPYMGEYGVPHFDTYGAIRGWRYIGWRGHVLLSLIKNGAITEEEAHREFGFPSSENSTSYLRQLYEYRNRKSEL